MIWFAHTPRVHEMNPKWRELDLEGGGLQAANLRLARTLRRRTVAYGLMLAFPLGAHRWYLGEIRSAVLYPTLTALALGSWLAGITAITLTALTALAALLGWDLYTLEDRIATVNKRHRMAVYLSQGSGAPAGFRGRFGGADGDMAADTAHRRIPTLAEQEAMLRDLAAHRNKHPEKPQ